MQEAKTLVPSFGSWDIDTEIPYTTVFEKVRATKDGKPLSSRGLDKSSQTSNRHHLQGNPSSLYPHYESDKYSNASSELHHCGGKRSMLDEWGFQTKKVVDSQSCSSRRSSLEQIADHIFTESQHAAGCDSPVISRQSTTSSTSWRVNQYINSRECREHYVNENIYDKHVPDILPGLENQGYHAYGSRVPRSSASPKKEHYFVNESNGQHALHSTPGIQSRQQPLQANHRSVEMPPDGGPLPKFGDWDAMDPTKVEFTVIFDKARNERKCSINQEYSIQSKTNPEVNEEDLYEPSSTQRRNGFWTLICCSRPSVS